MAREHTERVGARIRQRREELGLSQDDLARRIGLKATGNYVSRWERGQNKPDDDYLDLIAKALKTTLADLVGGPQHEKGATPDPFEARRPAQLELQQISAKLDAIMAHLEILPPDLEEIATDFEAEAERQAPARANGRSARTRRARGSR